MSSITNFDNLFLQTLMGRLQIHPPPPQYPYLSQSLEDLLFNVDGSSDDDDDDTSKTQLSKEESKLEKEIIRVILSGKTDSLKPNSGQAVTIVEHHICVGFHEEKGSDYRVWEWHGHIMLFDEEDGYTPEYIYGNYFERLLGKTAASTTATHKQEQEENEEEKTGNLGLRELIDDGDSGAARILHRIISAGSPSDGNENLLILLATVVSLVTIGCLVTIFSCISAGREYHIPQLYVIVKNLRVNRNQIDQWQHLSVIDNPSDELSIIKSWTCLSDTINLSKFQLDKYTDLDGRSAYGAVPEIDLASALEYI
ncbi:hypothetical protein OIU78_003287 [Salix suchowensis]|nr:hypothetical protein OIU78_003287 [Salix suchowensis]